MTNIMSNLLQSSKAIEKQIAEQFGLDELWYNLIDCTDELFQPDVCTDTFEQFNESHLDGITEVTYGYKNAQDYRDGNCFSFEIYGRSSWLSKDRQYMLFVGDQGDRDMYIFATKNYSEEALSEY